MDSAGMDPSSQQPASSPVSFIREFSFAQEGSGPGPSSNPASSQHPSAGRQHPPGNHHNHSHSHSQAPSRGPSAAPQQDISVLARTSIIVSKRQQGNPILAHIRNVRWVFGDIVPDYLLGTSTCALFLSLRYHLLHPDYIFVRIRELQKSFRLRVLLCHVDLDDVIKPLHDITKTALLHDCTLLCAWSPEECGRYLETLKSYENKPASNIQERTEHDYVSRVSGALTSIRHVNKTDSLTLCQTFGTLAAVLGAPMEELVRCPGIGDKKVRRLHDTFHEPFRRRVAKLPSKSAVNSANGVGNSNGGSGAVVAPQRGNGQRMDEKSAEERSSAGTAGAARPAVGSDGAAEGVVAEGATARDDTVQDATAQGEKDPSQAVVLSKAPSGEKSKGFRGSKGPGDSTNSTGQKRKEGEPGVEERGGEDGCADGVPEVTMSQLPDYGGSFMSSQPSSVLRKRSRGERVRNEEGATISPSLAEALGDTPGVLSP